MLARRATALGSFFTVLCVVSSGFAQSGADSAPLPPLQINVRNVLVDVVVTDKKGAAVHGLPKEQFQLFENGKSQKVEFFEEHSSSAKADGMPSIQLPPNTFTNLPRAEPDQAINLILMDALNTNLADQIFVRQQSVKYLSSVPPGLRVGVFLLGDRLRIIQGFTDNSTLLRASVERLAGKPTQAALQGTPDELASQSSSLGDFSSMADGPGGAQLAAMVAAMQSFLDQQTNVQKNQQLLITLDALQTIAHYVAAVPGRKNLIWFVGSFPLCLPGISATSRDCPYEDVIEKTMDALAAARVSIYPIDAGGIYAPNANIGGAGGNQGTSLVAGTSIPGAHSANASQDPYFQFIGAERWAEATGGRASHNNDIKGEIAADIENGSSYYTVAYTPTDPKEIGRERKIEIRLPEGNYKLSYRRAYFERTEAQIKAAATAPDHDPLRPLMDRGMPNFFDLKFQLRVEPGPGLPAAGERPIGDNPALKAPLQRYTTRFFLSPQDLNLVAGSDGVRRAPIEVALVAYSQRGDSLNWLIRSVNLAIRPDQMAFAQSNGIPFHFDFDIPPGEVYLRAGVYDPSTQRAGTLEIPVASIRPTTQVSAK